MIKSKGGLFIMIVVYLLGNIVLQAINIFYMH